MTDVLFYQNYTYVADISAIVLCIICWLLLHSSYAVREKSLVIFKAGTVCLMMATVCSISFHTAITRITESRKILIYVLQDGIYLLLILTFVRSAITSVHFLSWKRDRQDSWARYPGAAMRCLLFLEIRITVYASGFLYRCRSDGSSEFLF